MNLRDLETELREDFLEDTDSRKYNFSESRVLRWFNEAVREACRSPLLKDVKTFPVLAGTASYTLEDESLDIDEVSLALQTDTLIQSTKDRIESKYGRSWRDDEGTPSHYIREDLTLTLYPIPIVNDTMTVTLFRYPDRMYSFSESPEIPERYHQGLLYWCAYKAYLSPDVEQNDLAKSQTYLAMFDQYFGIKRSARFDSFQINSPKHQTVKPVRMC